jgi:2-keto-3-deoxy-L-rhamnonate aldolase RhmA
MLRRLSAAMLVVQFFGLSAQDRLTAVSETVTRVQSETRGTFSDLVQLPLDVTGVDAVLVMASIETRYGDAVNSREGIYRMTDGNSVSETVWQTLRKSGARDKQIGTLVHIFDASGLNGPVTYHLQHTSRVSKPVISSATLVAVALTTTETGYTLSFG